MIRLVFLLALAVSFGARADIEFGSDVSPQLKQALEGDLAFVQDLRGNAQTVRNHALYGEMTGSAYISWFQDRIEGIGYAGDQGPLPFAFVQPSNPNVMWLTVNVIKHTVPQAWRVGILWHEARHSETEHGNWSHVKCPMNLNDMHGQPLRSGLSGLRIGGAPGCDKTEWGAYGSSATMMRNIALYCTNCSEKIKSDAQLFFEDSTNRMVTDELRHKLLDDAEYDGADGN